MSAIADALSFSTGGGGGTSTLDDMTGRGSKETSSVSEVECRAAADDAGAASGRGTGGTSEMGDGNLKFLLIVPLRGLLCTLSDKVSSGSSVSSGVGSNDCFGAGGGEAAARAGGGIDCRLLALGTTGEVVRGDDDVRLA